MCITELVTHMMMASVACVCVRVWCVRICLSVRARVRGVGRACGPHFLLRMRRGVVVVRVVAWWG